jgi:lambda family phage minor tail protein L
MSGTIQQEIQKLAPSAMVTLYVFDLTPKVTGSNNKYYFHTGTNGLSLPMHWNGQQYQPWPIQISGFAANTGGAMPRLKVTMSNTSLLFTTLALNFNDLLGAQLTRIRTFARFIDAVNFPGNTNPNADPTQFLTPDVFFMEQKVTENKNIVELTFASLIDVEGALLPARQVTANMCAWAYRSGAGCPFTGSAVADILDNARPNGFTSSPTSAPFPQYNAATAYTAGMHVWYGSPASVFMNLLACTGVTPGDPTHWFADDCGKQLTSCQLRFGTGGSALPFGAFPGVMNVPLVSGGGY